MAHKFFSSSRLVLMYVRYIMSKEKKGRNINFKVLSQDLQHSCMNVGCSALVHFCCSNILVSLSLSVPETGT